MRWMTTWPDVNGNPRPGAPLIESAVVGDAEELGLEELPGSPGRGASVAAAPLSKELAELVVVDAVDKGLLPDDVCVEDESNGEVVGIEAIEEDWVEEVDEEILVVVWLREVVCVDGDDEGEVEETEDVEEDCDGKSDDELLVVVPPREEVVVEKLVVLTEEDVVDELVVVVELVEVVEEKLWKEVVEALVEEKLVDWAVDVVEGLATASRKYFKLFTTQYASVKPPGCAAT